MLEYFAGCFLLETTVFCSLNFTISLPSPWEVKDGPGKFNPRSFTKRLWFMWWLQKQDGLKCSPQGELPATAFPKNQECVVLSLAVLLPGWCLCGFGVRVLSAEAGQSKLLAVMPLWLPSLQLHLLHKSSSTHSSPCPTLCQRFKKEKTFFLKIFLTLMKTCINKANLSHMKNRKVGR